MRPTPLARVACVLAALAALAPAARAAEPDEARLALIRPRMQRFVDDHVIAGAVTVVGTGSGLTRIEAVGSLRLDPTEPMPKDALFRIASMTKPITAAGVLILADEGKLAVDDPVEKHLPEFRGQMLVAERGPGRLVLKKPARPITLRDLLTHTSGLPAYPPGLGDLYRKRDRTLAEATLAVSQRPLDFEPGSRWAYCNSGIDTLGRVIEVVSGQSYETFLARKIFEPLGMKDTTFRPSRDQLRRLAGLYGVKDGKLVPAPDALIGPPAESRHPIPAGGLYSTGADLVRFYRMMLGGGTLDGQRILSEASVKAMTSVQTGDLKCGFTPEMGWGLGFGVVRKPEGVTAMLSPGSFGHGGAFGTQSWADPKQNLFVILLIQRTGLANSDASEMRRELQRLAVAALRPAGEKHQVLSVWPGKVPGENGQIGEEKVQESRPNEKPVKRLTNVSKPTITIFRPARDKDTGAAVVICPGGGYNILAWDLEGEEVASWLNSVGVTGIVLKYRVPRRPDQPRDKPPLGPLQDAQRALSLVRSRAGEWGLDPQRIGILGFSAGGHLAAAAATNFDKRAYEPVDDIDKVSCRPDFAVLVYPAYLIARGKDELSPDIRVRKECPPMFLVHAGDDPISAENSVRMYLALKRVGVKAELHVYASGGHGFGLRPSRQPCSTWPQRCADWMRSQGILKPRAD
jgi:CubicO group peptidase (beta-lactamase class C family)/acetyl esterase/lipase